MPDPYDEVRQDREAADDTRLENKVYDAIIRAVYEQRPQQIASSPAVIAQVIRIVSEVRKDVEPSLRWKVAPAAGGRTRLELWSDSSDHRLGEAVIAPEIAERAVRTIDRLNQITAALWPGRRSQVESCAYCGAIQGIGTSGIYRVESPALSEPLTLCAKHAASETVVPGAMAVPA